MDTTATLWLLAVSPVVLLLVLVLKGVRTGRAAGVVVGWVLFVGAVVFAAPADLLAVAMGKGLWLGFWILLVVWPALLLYRLAAAAGLEEIGRVFASVLPRRRENLLIMAWIFPSFVQGIAGFGTPIAVAAPLLVAMGWSRTRAVIYPLVGYHWAVTFGSMGSSFYMASLTAGLSSDDQALFALTAASILAVNCLVAGALVLLLDGGLDGLREGWRTLLVAGVPMAVTLVLVAQVVPAVASLAAGTAGLVAVGLSSAVHRRGGRSERDVTNTGRAESAASEIGFGRSAVLLSPYAYLLAVALPVFLWPTSRRWAQNALVLGPDLPRTETGRGWVNEAVTTFNPVVVLSHPGFYVAVACVLGFVTYHRAGLWKRGATGEVLGAWARSLPQASVSILLLASVATVLVDTGMVFTLATGISSVAGGAFPVLAPVVGATGSFLTGSTTSSNALFTALQHEVASQISVPSTALLAAQTAGGNVGNAIAPVIVLVGATSVGASDSTGQILRACLVPVGVLLLVVVAGTLLWAA